MSQRRTPAGAQLTELILEIFRLNGRLLAAGEGLVADLGLTSARWQVLGAIALAPAPEPVAYLARRMGLTRQAVQRVANDLQAEGFVEFGANPHHQRAQLVVLTERGRAAYLEAQARQIPWSNRLGEGLAATDVAGALRIVSQINARLEDDDRSRAGGAVERKPAIQKQGA